MILKQEWNQWIGVIIFLQHPRKYKVAATPWKNMANFWGLPWCSLCSFSSDPGLTIDRNHYTELLKKKKMSFANITLRNSGYLAATGQSSCPQVPQKHEWMDFELLEHATYSLHQGPSDFHYVSCYVMVLTIAMIAFYSLLCWIALHHYLFLRFQCYNLLLICTATDW